MRLLLTVGLCLGAASARAQEKDHASWWITQYGLVDPTQEPLAARARTIFERLAAAADKRANRFPKLAVLDAEGNPLALALPDGTILLTRGALRICYRKVSESVGDARLAFVVGHELSHLGNDDFWHAAAFDSVQLHGGVDPSGAALKNILVDSDVDAAKRELQADAYGMFYMTTAGYDPRELFRKDSFFEEWSAELDALGIRAVESHPASAERGTFLRTQLSAVSDEMDFFHFGVRFVQLGRFNDALLLLEKFRDRFPSREVLNDIGLAHFQLAARYLGECDGRLVVRFKLPTVLDPSTRAARIMSGSGTSPCFRSERFRLHFREAETNFTKAAEMDPEYAAARLNLLSLYALAQQGAQALVAAEDAKGLLPDDPRVQSGAAIALYLYGEQSGLEVADTALEQLQTVHREHPETSSVAYNLAGILAERRRTQGAESAYRAFLALEPHGIHADAARDYLGEIEPSPVTVGAEAPSAPSPPLPLGPLARDALSRTIPGLRFQDFVIGDFSGTFLTFDGGRAIAIDGIVELVDERAPASPPALSEILKRHGVPRQELRHSTGRLLVYESFALEVENGAIVHRVYF